MVLSKKKKLHFSWILVLVTGIKHMKTFNILTNTDKLIINKVAYMVTSYNNQTTHTNES